MMSGHPIDIMETDIQITSDIEQSIRTLNSPNRVRVTRAPEDKPDKKTCNM